MPIIAMPSPNADAEPTVDWDATLPARAGGILRGLVPARAAGDAYYRVDHAQQQAAGCDVQAHARAGFHAGGGHPHATQVQ